MSPKSKKAGSKTGIVVDIAGVTPSTQLGELTVAQFVSLLAQVMPQIRGGSATEFRAELAEQVLGRIREVMTKSGDKSPLKISQEVTKAQLAVIDQMPRMMKSVARDLKKTGGDT